MAGVDIATLEPLMQQVNERTAAMMTEFAQTKQALEPASVEAMVKSILESLLTGTPEFGRKLAEAWKTGGGNHMSGSKFQKWGVSLGGIEAMYDMLSDAKMRNVSKGPSEELTNAFNHLSKAYFLSADEAKNYNLRSLTDELQRYKGSPNTWSRETWAMHDQAVKAMDTAESGYGNQLIGAQYSSDLWIGARRDSRLFSLLDTVEMTAPTMYIPCEADLPEMLLLAENTDAPSDGTYYTTTKTGSNRVTLTAKKLAFHQVWSGEMEEDSIIPFIEYLLLQIREAMAIYSDSLYLNADTTDADTGNINLDDANPANTKHYLAFDGIRHAWIIDVAALAQGIDVAGPVTYNDLQNLKQLLVDGTYFHDWGNPTKPEDCIYLCDPETANEISKLSEVLTVDKYGTGAAVLTGEIAKIGANPLIPLPAYKKTEADGRVSTTASNNTKGQVTCFNRRAVKAGWRRQVKIETERIPGRDQTRLIYHMRLACGRFTPTGAVTGFKWASGLYDISLAT